MERCICLLMCSILLCGRICAFPIPQSGNHHDPILSTQSPRHLKQWEGGCNLNCDEKLAKYCGLGPWDRRCHDCGMFCDQDSDGKYTNEDLCEEECPALYDELNAADPTTAPSPADNETTPVEFETQTEDLETLGTLQATSSETPSSVPSTSSKPNVTLEVLPDTEESTGDQKKSWIEYTYAHWVLGGLSIVVACVIAIPIIIVVVLKRTIFKPKGPETPVPSQCSEDHRCAPTFYQGNRRPRPGSAQRVNPSGSNIPLLQDPSRHHRVNRPSRQQHPASLHSQPASSNGMAPCSSQETGSYRDRVLASGAETSFIPGDQNGYTSRPKSDAGQPVNPLGPHDPQLQDPSLQQQGKNHPSRQQPAASLHSQPTSTNKGPCSPEDPTCSSCSDRVLASGAEMSFVPGDQNEYSCELKQLRCKFDLNI